MFDETIKRPSGWQTLWPNVSDRAGVRDAIRIGVWSAILAAVVSAETVVTAWLDGGYVLAPLVNAAIYGLVGFGIHHGWRAAALYGVLLVGYSIVAAVAQGQFPRLVSPFVLIGLINGVRGTFALKRTADASGRSPT